MHRAAPLVLQQLEFIFLLFVFLMFAVTAEVTLPLCTSCLVCHCCKIHFSGKVSFSVCGSCYLKR